MTIEKACIPNADYWRCLAGNGIDDCHAGKVSAILERRALSNVLVYGDNDTIGRFAKRALGARFAGFVNAGTVDPDMRAPFDAFLLAVSPRSYARVAASLEAMFGSERPIIALFEDDPETRNNSKGQPVPLRPCHLDQVLIRFDGRVYPCCQVYNDRSKAICSIADGDVAASLRDFDMDCSCADMGFRPLRPAETLDIDTVICELSLLCNSKCAMCCVHSPEYTEEFGKSAAGVEPVIEYEAVEKALLELQPRYVTFQGGEVLIDQTSLDWIEGFRKKHPDFHTTLVTNGNVPAELADTTFRLFDHCVVDFYGFQDFTYKTVTGLELRRVKAFAERLLALDRRRVTLKYLSTPVNFHETPLFLEWGISRKPDCVAIFDADSDWYIRNDPLLRIPRFDPCGSTDLLPNIYWSRIISRTVERLQRIVERNSGFCRENDIFLTFWGGLFHTYPVRPSSKVLDTLRS